MSDAKKKKRELKERKAKDREAREKAIRDRQPLSVRERIHQIIFGADTFWGAFFDIVLLLVIIASIVVICLETVPGLGVKRNESDLSEVLPYKDLLFWLHCSFTGFFTLEYVLRVYCVRRPWKYIFSFWGIVDLLSFLPDYFLLGTAAAGGATGRMNSFSVIRSLRLLRVFRIFKLGWFQNEADDLGNAIWRARAKIVVFLTAVLIIVTVTGTLMYEIERGGPENQFDSIPTGIYWAIVTMTTVGFGDIVPKTVPGQFLSACLILVGYSLIIVPTGFVSAEVIDSKRKKRGAAKKPDPISVRSCASCLTEGHDADAVYCKFCGELM